MKCKDELSLDHEECAQAASLAILLRDKHSVGKEQILSMYLLAAVLSFIVNKTTRLVTSIRTSLSLAAALTRTVHRHGCKPGPSPVSHG